MTSFAYMRRRTDDWEMTSYGDIGAFVGLGAGIWHYRFRSPRVGRRDGSDLDTLLVAGGAGAAADIAIRGGDILDAFNRIRGAAGAEGSYTALRCRREFSMQDIVGGFVVQSPVSAAIGYGVTAALFTLVSSGVGRAGRPILVNAQRLTGDTLGAGVGGALVAGFLVGIGRIFREMNMQIRFERELQRRPSDPVLRDPGVI